MSTEQHARPIGRLTPEKLAERLTIARRSAAALTAELADIEENLLAAVRNQDGPASYREMRRHVAQAHDEAAGLRDGLVTLTTRAQGTAS